MPFNRDTEKLNLRAGNDWFTVAAARTLLRLRISEGLRDAELLARDLQMLDPDQFMVDLRAEFDPLLDTAAIQDCFSDAFGASLSKIKDSGGEPVTASKTLPSGAEL